MEQTDKQVYEAPLIRVFEVKTEGVICVSTLSVMWLTSEPSSSEIDWGRSSYGNAETETWD